MGRRRRAGRAGMLGRLLLAVPLLVVAAPLPPASAQTVSVGLSMTPQFPALVTVGDADVPAQLTVTNATSTGVGPITLTEITLNPACGSLSLDCTPPDPGVFALPATATGTGGACAGRTFSITPPDASGRSTFVPVGGPVVLATPGQATSACTIAFTFRVLKAPTVDAMPAAAGLQTAHVATVTGTGQVPGGVTGIGTARGLVTSNVNKALPALTTQASAGVPVGGSVSDTATLAGPVAVTGTVGFALYGPNDAACQAAPVFTSVRPAGPTVTSASFAPSQPGTYRFVATYSGDANNVAVTGNCADPAEAVVVGQEGGRFHPLTPARVLDTRTGVGGFAGPVGPATTIDLQVTGQGGVPASGVTAVAMNVTVTGPTGDGYLTVFPTGTVRPVVSNLNFTPGDTVPNLVVAKVGAGGRVSLFNSTGNSHLVVDVTGWYAASGAGDDGRYQPLVPARILDTRTGLGGGARLGPGASLEVQVAGQGGVPPAGAGGAVLNVTATNTTGTSYLTVYPSGEPRPLASNLNFDAGDTVANRVMTKLGSGGRVTVFNGSGSTDVIVDVGGWYTDASVAGLTGTYTALDPVRIVDTRLGLGGVAGPVGGGTTTSVQVAGRGGVPASGVSAVVLNVTAVSPGGPGWLTLYPSGSARPNASDLNFAAGETRANLVVVRVGPDGRVDLYASAATHFLFDVAGWYT